MPSHLISLGADLEHQLNFTGVESGITKFVEPE